MDRWVLIRCPYTMNTISLKPVVMSCFPFLYNQDPLVSEYHEEL
jgi:hypothetical protein